MDDDKKELAERDGTARPRLEKLRPDTPALKQPQQLRQQVTAGKKETLRNTGIDILGDVRWGTHFCLFYHTKEDLIDILVPYFKAGLDNNEFCMWVTSEPLNAEDAKKALKHAVRNLDAYLRKGQIEILDYTDWYTKSGAFEADSVLQGWIQKHDQAIINGFDGLRLTGNTFWLEKKDWVKFTDYEAVVNNVIGKYKMLAVCTYSLDKCGASEILDVEHNHQFALIKWKGDWKILESSSKNQLETRLAEQTAIAQALERSKKDWVKTFNAMSDWVAFIDLKGRILRTNRAGENFTGKPIAEIIGQSCCKLVHGSDKHIPGCPLRIMLHTRQRATAELQVPSTNRWLMVTTDPVIDKKGNLIGAVHVTRDISERKKAEEALRESEERFQQVAENTQEWIWEVDANGLYTYASLIVEKILDYKPEEIVGKKHFYDLFHPEDKEELKKEAFETFAKKESFRGFINRNVHKNGETVWLSTSGIPILDEKGNLLGYRGADTDITERKKAEEAIRAANQQLQANEQQLKATNQQLRASQQQLLDYQGQLKSLASQLTLTEERERRRIAADLHDHVSQSLSFSKMKLEAIRIAESSAETERVLAEVSDLLGQTIDDTRSLTFDLSSPILYELGFEAAVADWLTEQIERKHNIKTEFKDDRQPKPLDDDIRVLLFRNVKELLINVIKHAHTGKVKVSIRKAGTQIRISVEDDGVGFDPAETMSMAARRAEFGLFSIRERLEELGGYLEIDSVPGRGCRVTMTTPLKNAKK